MGLSQLFTSAYLSCRPSIIPLYNPAPCELVVNITISPTCSSLPKASVRLIFFAISYPPNSYIFLYMRVIYPHILIHIYSSHNYYMQNIFLQRAIFHRTQGILCPFFQELFLVNLQFPSSACLLFSY